MSSTPYFTGLGDNHKPSTKVLRSPGGGSSDIFGADSEPKTVKNRMSSSIFVNDNDDGQKNVKISGGDSTRRTHKNVDSYSRLFGEPEHVITPAKDFRKSSISIDPNAVENNDASTPPSSSPLSSSSVLTKSHAANNENRIENGGDGHQNAGFKKSDGNPITGEGYKPAGTETNTSVLAMNDDSQTITKNRIFPGSSGL